MGSISPWHREKMDEHLSSYFQVSALLLGNVLLVFDIFQFP